MIRKYKLHLQTENNRLRPDHAYALYGELMSRIDVGIAEELHMDGFTPIAQHIEFENGGADWIINTFDDQIASSLENALDVISELLLNDSGIVVKVSKAEMISETDFEALIKAPMGDENRPAWKKLEFVSPTGFKSNGQYVLFPSSDLILKSLIAKWNAACSDYILDDEEMLKLLLSGVSISGYRLSSRDFRMKNQHIPAFVGSVTLRARLSEPLLKIYSMLLAFGGYSGVGIKTALGMGGISFNIRDK